MQRPSQCRDDRLVTTPTSARRGQGMRMSKAFLVMYKCSDNLICHEEVISKAFLVVYKCSDNLICHQEVISKAFLVLYKCSDHLICHEEGKK